MKFREEAPKCQKIKLGAKPLISQPEMSKAGIDPVYGFDDTAARERAARFSVLRVRRNDYFPPIDYPEKAPFDELSDVIEYRDDYNNEGKKWFDREYAKLDFERGVVHEVNEKLGDKDDLQNQKKYQQYHYLLEKRLRSGSKLICKKHDNDIKTVASNVNMNLSERDLYILGQIYEAGIDPGYYQQSFFEKITDIPLLEKTLKRVNEFSITHGGKKIKVGGSDISIISGMVQEMGESYLEVIVAACKKTETIARVPKISRCLKDLRNNRPTDQLYSDAHFFQLLSELDIEDAVFAADFVNAFQRDAELHWGKMKLDEFVYLADLLAAHKSDIEHLQIDPEFIRQKGLENLSFSMAASVLIYQPDNLPLPDSSQTAHWKTIEATSQAYVNENFGFIHDLNDNFKIDATKEKIDIARNGTLDEINEKYSSLRYLSLHRELQDFVMDNFEISSLDRLSEVTDKILAERGNPQFESKVFAILKLNKILEKSPSGKIENLGLFHPLLDASLVYFLSDLFVKAKFDFYEATKGGWDYNMLLELKKWQMNPTVFKKAVDEGMIGPSRGDFNKFSILHGYDSVSSIVQNPDLLRFIKENKDTDALEAALRWYGSENAIINEWFRDQDSFEKAKAAGLFSRKKDGTITDNFKNYASIARIMSDPELVEFLKGNASLGIWEIAIKEFNSPESREARSIKSWQEDSAAYDAGMKLGIFLAGPYNFLQYDKLHFLQELSDQDMESIKVLFNGSYNEPFRQFVPKYAETTPEKRQLYIDIFQAIMQSPSQEIKRIRDQLLLQLLESSDPKKSFQVVENIFIRNNLPLVGKVFKIFQALFPSDAKGEFYGKNALGPVLRKSSDRRRFPVIYNDLMKVHIESGNRNLKEYLEVIRSGQAAVDKLDEWGEDNLSGEEREQVEFFFARMQTLLDNSQIVKYLETRNTDVSGNLQKSLDSLKADLGVREGQTFSERITEMFLRPLGFARIEEVLARMKEIKQTADRRGREVAEEAAAGKLTLRDGDLLKGVDINYLENILQNGSVAKEYLGANSMSDGTPFDTDVSLVVENDIPGGFENCIDSSMAVGYGRLLFVVRDRGQFQKTDDFGTYKYDSSRLELFPIGGAWGGRHGGIRTGFPSTEIDMMVAMPDLLSDPKELKKTFLEVAQNGFYIPIVDKAGQLIYTPEKYQEYRRIYDGLDKFDGDPFVFIPPHRNVSQLQDIEGEILAGKERTAEASRRIRDIIQSALEKNGVKLRDVSETNILGAELLNVGSTSRLTHDPRDQIDFDLSIVLDEQDYSKEQDIRSDITNKLDFQELIGGRANMLRLKGVEGLDAMPVDLDIAFVKKTDQTYFGSHDAVRERLESIKNRLGEGIYRQTLANIVLAKRLLKEGRAYKKYGQGGMGGMGIENWILAHNGNITEAFQAFYNASHQGDRIVSIIEFHQNYQLVDPGVDVLRLTHDNFIDYLTSDGYQNMVKVVENYLQGATPKA